MLSAVIIILREALEASLIVSTLLVSSRIFGISNRWTPWALVSGVAGAAITALFLGTISEWFEGAGQELLNAAMLILVTLLLTGISFCIARCARRNKCPVGIRAMQAMLIGAMATAIIREGTEIVIYIYGFSYNGQMLVPVLLGGGIGLGIGISVGVLVYYGLLGLPARYILIVTPVLIALVASGMASEAVLYLIQANWLPSQMPLWDTGGWISEPSLLGQLLYALIAYEATPTPLQAGVHGFTLLLILSLTAWGTISKDGNHDKSGRPAL